MDNAGPRTTPARHRHRGKILVAALCGCLLGAGAVSAQPHPSGESAVPRLAAASQDAAEVIGGADEPGGYVYRIGAEDRLAIRVRGEPDLSGDFVVRPDGRINLPLVGEIEAVGRTVPDVAEILRERLEAFIDSPQVSVTVADATGTMDDRVRVIGKAVEPRSYSYRDGLSALSLLTEMGGLPPGAAGNRARILRRVNGRREVIPLRLDDLLEEGELGADRPLEPGDVLVIPTGFFAGDSEFSYSLGAAQTYTDNISLLPAGFRDHALISEIIPGVTLRMDAERIQAAIDATIRLQYLAETTVDDFSIAPDVRGTANVELLDSLFFLDVSAAIDRQIIDSTRGRSGSASNIQNQQMTQSYRVSPYVTNRLGRFATVEARYVGQAIFIESNDTRSGQPVVGNFGADDSVQHSGRLRVESGPAFGRLDWRLDGEWTKTELDDGPDRRRREAVLRLDYALTRSFYLVALGGYQNFEGSDFQRRVDDPLYMGGFRWAPSPRTELEALAGQDNGDESLSVQFRHDVSDDLTIQISYDEEAAIDQQRLGNRLPQTIDDFNNPVQPPLPNFTFRGDPTRTKTLTGDIVGRFGLASLQLGASYEQRSLGVFDGVDDEDLVRVDIAFSYPLTRNLAFNGQGDYLHRKFKEIENLRPASNDDEVRASAGLSYSGFRNLVFSLDYIFSKDISTVRAREFTENAVTFTISAQF